MAKALNIYKDLLKEYGITDVENVQPVSRLTYLQEQVAQQRAILNRLLFDLTVARIFQDEAKDQISKDAHRKKGDDYRNDIHQILGALRLNLQLIDELRAEYTELTPEA
jgi:hypothetical protein